MAPAAGCPVLGRRGVRPATAFGAIRVLQGLRVPCPICHALPRAMHVGLVENAVVVLGEAGQWQRLGDGRWIEDHVGGERGRAAPQHPIAQRLRP